MFDYEMYKSPGHAVINLNMENTQLLTPKEGTVTQKYMQVHRQQIVPKYNILTLMTLFAIILPFLYSRTLNKSRGFFVVVFCFVFHLFCGSF
jgi:hypothetical protein